MRKHVLEKIVKSEESKRKYSARRCHVRATHKKRSETRYICKFCLVPLKKMGNVSRDITPSSVTRSLDKFSLKMLVQKNN
jgi:hypothetical protein